MVLSNELFFPNENKNFYDIIRQIPQEAFSDEIFFNDPITHPIPQIREHWPDLSNDDTVKKLPIEYPFEDNATIQEIGVTDTEKKSDVYYVEEFGFEICAFYRSYHFTGIDKDHWGIFILHDCALKLAENIYNRYRRNKLSLTKKEAYFHALRILFYHEFFHYLHDFALTKLEILLEKPIYIPYFKRIYSKDFPDAFEESVANRYVYTQIKRDEGNNSTHCDLKIVKEILDRQPAAYGRWEQLNLNFQKDYLANMALERSSNPRINKYLRFLYKESLPGMTKKRIPVYLITDQP